ncbi:MAG: hypothetical protein V3V97_09685 [Hyphomicrobiaceae bacterium]
MLKRIGFLLSFTAGLAAYHVLLADGTESQTCTKPLATSHTATSAIDTDTERAQFGAGLISKKREGSLRTFSADSPLLRIDDQGAFLNRSDESAQLRSTINAANATDADDAQSRSGTTVIAKIEDTLPNWDEEEIARAEQSAAYRAQSIDSQRTKHGAVPLPLRAGNAREWVATARRVDRDEQDHGSTYARVEPTFADAASITSDGWSLEVQGRHIRQPSEAYVLGDNARPRIYRGHLGARTYKRRLVVERARRKRLRKPYGLTGNGKLRRSDAGRPKVRKRNTAKRRRKWIKKVFRTH